jgi:hypothetical protein
VLLYWSTYTQRSISHALAKYIHYSFEDGISSELYLNIHLVPRRKHYVSIIKKQSVNAVWGSVINDNDLSVEHLHFRNSGSAYTRTWIENADTEKSASRCNATDWVLGRCMVRNPARRLAVIKFYMSSPSPRPNVTIIPQIGTCPIPSKSLPVHYTLTVLTIQRYIVWATYKVINPLKRSVSVSYKDSVRTAL